jgi:hypothetical protein
VRERAVVTAVRYVARVAAGRTFIGVAEQVLVVHMQMVVVIDEGLGHSGSVEHLIGLASVVKEAHVARTDHAMLESSTFCQVLD